MAVGCYRTLLPRRTTTTQFPSPTLPSYAAVAGKEEELLLLPGPCPSRAPQSWKVLRYRAPRASRRRSPSTRHSWVKTAAQPSLCAGGLLLHLVVARLLKPEAKAILGHLITMCPFPIMRFCALVSILSAKYNAKMALRWMMHLPRSGTIQLTFLGFVVEYNMYILFAHAFCLVNSLKSALGQNIFMMK